MWTYQSMCYWVRVNEDGTQKKKKKISGPNWKKHFQDDYIFWNEAVEKV